MKIQPLRMSALIVLLFFSNIDSLRSSAQEVDSEPDAYQAKTTADIDISEIKLNLMVRPLTKEQLQVEADAWTDLYRQKINETVDTELQMVDLAPDAPADALTTTLAELRTAERDLSARLTIVLDELDSKGGDTAEVRQYLVAVSDISDTADTTAYRVALIAKVTGWLTSEEGGIYWLRRGFYAVLILLVVWMASRYAGRVVGKALGRHPRTSGLLENFARRTAGGVVMVIGVLMALSILGVEIGPMMAALGAGGFIVGFALQETLGSFASGLMIMVYRPFDVDDYVSVAGVEGTVKEMSLVSTRLVTIDNKVLIIPNKMAWGDTIVNYTDREVRRVDLVFGISYDDDIRHALAVLRELAESHELTLDEPGVTVRVSELADSSVNLICRPWTKTTDYWTVYWDLMHQVKERFDAEGLHFPYPQRDVHLDSPAVAAE